jgi:hypothetical protein
MIDRTAPAVLSDTTVAVPIPQLLVKLRLYLSDNSDGHPGQRRLYKCPISVRINLSQLFRFTPLA